MPLEGLGMTVALVEIIEHRLLQMAHSCVAAAPDAPLGHFCEQPFYEIEPASAGGREVHVIARMPRQPGLHFADLMSTVFVAGSG